MELTRPRKMELLHTPKMDLLRMLRENSLTIEDVVFLFASNKMASADIRMNAPSICDKMLTMFLRQAAAAASTAVPNTESEQETAVSPPMAA
jgi:hypothetical protein